MEPKSPSKLTFHVMGLIHNSKMVKFGVTILIIFGLALVGGYFIFRPNGVQYVSKTGSVYYTVVLDCGSSGSRVNVYEWMMKDGARDGEDLPVLLHTYPDNLTKSGGCQYHCMQTEPGLDKFVGNASGVGVTLEPLIHWAEQWVPVERRGETPIFVLATAGMRRLSLENVRRVLGDVEDVVREHGFLYRESWIRVLTGKEEAYYGWVALNYKMGVLRNTLRLPTFGLLDLGGSSLQVVAEVDELIDDEHVLNSKVGSFEHRILTYSLPAFGLNEAFDRTIVMLSHTPALRESAAGALEVRHPCLGSRFSQNYTCHACFGLNSSDLENSSSLVTRNALNSIFLSGEPDWARCKALVRAAAINASNLESLRLGDHSSCIGLSSYGGNNVLNLSKSSQSVTRYHALSGFFAVYNMLNLSSRANLTKMWEKGQQLCSKSWADHNSIYRQYCFRAAYMTSLIEDALCLSDKEIIFGPGDVSWTLGAALVEGDYLWRNITKSRTHILSLKINEMISSPFILFALLLCLLIFVYRSQIKLPMRGRKVSSGLIYYLLATQLM